MIKSVVRYFKWTPETIDQLFLDDYDHHGLVYWYKDVEEQEKAMKNHKKK
ncbi:hypothetical protein C7967_11543 [Thalassospira sp. 11-3]|nr:hypothetical protein C7967_11543 [Thalassospira sp. 11-3]